MMHGLVLFTLIVAAPITAVALVGYGLGRRGAWRSGRRARVRSVAALAGATAVAVYGLGLLCLVGAVLDADDGGSDSAPLHPCRVPSDPDRASHVTGYSVGFVPLRFVCETADGTGYSAPAVPSWVNPADAGLALAAAACACAAATPLPARRPRRSVPA